MSSTSLDDLLREIETEQGGDSTSPTQAHSAGLEDLSPHETPPVQPNSSPFLVPEMIGNVPQLTREMVGGGNVVSEQALAPESLSERQRRLPKISIHMVGSVLAVLVLVFGLGSSVLLSQQKQDVRQQAYEGTLSVEERERAGENAAEESTAEETTEQISEETSETSESIDETQAISQEEPAGQPASQPAAPWWQHPVAIAGGAVLLSAVLLLGVFFHWLFAV